MNKDIKYFGIDISHLVFDVPDSDGTWRLKVIIIIIN
jgi:transposase